MNQVNLQEYLKRLELTLELAEIGYWEWIPLTGELKLSDWSWKILGYQTGQIEANYLLWRNSVHQEDIEKVEQALTYAIAHHTTYEQEYRIIWPDGSEHWILDKGGGVYDEAGQIIYMVGSFIDITKRKETEIALAVSEQRLSLALSAAKAGLWEWNSNSDKVTWNEITYNLQGKPQKMTGIQIDVSERKQAEAALIESEAKLRSILNNAPSLILMIRADGTILYINRPINGINIEEYIGKNIQNLTFLESKETQKKAIEKVFNTKESVNFESLGVGNNNKNEYYHVVIDPVCQKEKICCAIMMATNISERKQAEKALQQSEQRFRTLFDAIPKIAVQGYNRHRQVIYWNQASEKLYGYSKQEAINKQLEDLIIPPGMRSQVIDSINAWIEQGREIPAGELNLLAKDGSLIPVYSSHVMLTNTQGEPELYCVDIDLTENRKAQAECDRLFKVAADVLCIAGFDGYFKRVNPAFEILLGYRLGELLDRPLIEFVHPEDVELTCETLTELSQGITKTFENRYLCCDGSYRWLVWTGVPFVKEDLIYFTAHDISDRKQAEAAMQNLIEGTASVTGKEFFPVLVEHTAKALNVNHVLVCQLIKDELHTLLFWSNGELKPNFSFPLRNTPCEITINQGSYYCPVSVQENFPEDIYLKLLNSQSYLGVALANSAGEAIGNLCVLDSNPISQPEKKLGIMRAFAARAAAELERIRALEELQQLNLELETRVCQRTAELEAIFNQAAVGIAQVDLNQRFIKVNQRLCNMLGYTAEELSQKTFTDVTYFEDIPQSIDFYNQLISGIVESYSLEKRYVCKQGLLIWVNVTTSTLVNSIGHPNYMIAVIEDISDRKKAESALSESERKFRAIFNNSFQFVGLVTTNGILIEINQTALDFAGVSLEEVINQPFWETNWWNNSIANQEQLKTAIACAAKGEFVRYEVDVRGAKGKDAIIDFSLRPLLDESGQVVMLIPEGRDITDRKKAEESLRQSALQDVLVGLISERIRESLNLKEILDTAVRETRQLLKADRVIIYRIETDGTGKAIAESVSQELPKMLNMFFPREAIPLECYQRYCEGYIYSLKDCRNSNLLPYWQELIERFQVKAKLVVPIVQNNNLWGLLIVHQCSNLREWESWEIELLKQLADQLAIAIRQSELYQQAQNELTERKKAEKQLQEINEKLIQINFELARANRLKDEFLANMSHELRTPLNAILGITEGLQDEIVGSLNPRQIQGLATIEKSGKHLLELINDILDLAKIEAGKMELERVSISVQKICDDSIMFVKEIANKKNIELIANIPAQLPQIAVDERRMRQILINLLSNAIKFTKSGGSVTLQVSFKESEKMIIFDVIDTGIGIGIENISKLFQSFVQVDSSYNRQYNGTGLGLALVRSLTELHGGSVSVKSELGKGSCFRVKIPY